MFLPAVGGEGQPCFENGTCKPGLACISGTCREGCRKDSECGDDVACTRDECRAGVCAHIPDDTRCPDDGEFCNGVEYCHETTNCSHRDPPCAGTCDEANDVCAGCGDGVVTEGSENCDPAPPQSDECCDPATCQWAQDGAECGTRHCAYLEWRKGVCDDHECAGEAVAARCNDNNECTVDTCDDALGCHNAPVLDGTECGSRSCDGLVWKKQVCEQGACAASVWAADCDDNNSCTGDVCDPAAGCENTLVPNSLPDICGSGIDENCDGVVDGCCGPVGDFAAARRFAAGTGRSRPRSTTAPGRGRARSRPGTSTKTASSIWQRRTPARTT